MLAESKKNQQRFLKVKKIEKNRKFVTLSGSDFHDCVRFGFDEVSE